MRFCGIILCLLALAYARQDSVYTIAEAYTSLGEKHDQPQAVADGHRGAWIVFTGTRGPGKVPNIILQHLDADGKLTLMADGWQICPSEFRQINPSVIRTSTGELFVLWEEQREFLRGIYGIKFNRKGEPLWSPKGEYLAPVNELDCDYQAVEDGAGGIYLAWEDNRGIERIRQVYVQHIAAYGLPMWQFDGQLVADVEGIMQKPRIDLSPDAELLVLWEDFRSNNGWDLYTQKFSAGGEPIWERLGVHIPAAIREANMQQFRMQSDGFGGILCAYVSLSMGTQGTDIYMLRVTRNGVPAYNVPVCRAVGNQRKPGMVVKGADVVVYWEDSRAQDMDLYVQRVEIQRGTAWWQANGVLACLSGDDQIEPTMAKNVIYGDQVFVWLDDRNNSTNLFAQKINNQGMATWAFEGVELTATTSKKRNLVSVTNEKGGAWVFWIDEKDPVHPRLHFNQVDAFGVPGAIRPMFIPHKDSNAVIAFPEVVAGSLGDYYVAWEDYRNGWRNSDIYVQHIDTSGMMNWTQNGYPVCAANSYQSLPQLINTDMGLQLAWLDHRNELNDDIYHQLLSYDGRMMRRRNGSSLCQASRSQNDLSINLDANGKLLAAWTDSRLFIEEGFNIYYARQDLMLDSMLVKDGIRLSESASYQTAPSIGVDRVNNTYISWMDDRSGYYNVRMQLLDPEGEPQWGSHGKAIAAVKAHQRYPDMITLPDGGAMVAWADDRAGETFTKVHLERMLPRGIKALGEDGKMLCSRYGRQTHPRLLALEGNGALVTWLDERDTIQQGHLLMAQWVDGQANPKWDAAGIQIGEFLGENYPFRAVYSPMGYVAYVWQARVGKEGDRVYYAIQNLESGKIVSKGRLHKKDIAQVQPVIANLFDQFAVVWVEKQGKRCKLQLKFIKIPDQS